jgi:hypothetical protein
VVRVSAAAGGGKDATSANTEGRRVVRGVSHHVKFCLSSAEAEERERMEKLLVDGLRVTRLARALVTLGRCTLGRLQNKLKLEDSEFEPLVFCLLRPAGMSTEALRALVL